MEQPLKAPDFHKEADEARWWASQSDELVRQFQQAATEGKLGRGTVSRRGNTPPITIRLDPADVLKAKAVAERKGLRYQTYLKMLIHEALQQEEFTKS